jgi:hypothetical protein
MSRNGIHHSRLTHEYKIIQPAYGFCKWICTSTWSGDRPRHCSSKHPALRTGLKGFSLCVRGHKNLHRPPPRSRMKLTSNSIGIKPVYHSLCGHFFWHKSHVALYAALIIGISFLIDGISFGIRAENGYSYLWSYQLVFGAGVLLLPFLRHSRKTLANK